MFKILEKSNNARKGIIKTARGTIQTPFFMPDATRGYVKGLSVSDLEMAGVGPMVVNTFHLYLQPGLQVIKKAVQGNRAINSVSTSEIRCIHKFMNWPHPLLSDSGGFQVFSLIHKNPKMGQIDDKGVIFRSSLDGSLHKLTPEKVIQIQFDLGVDMLVCLDDCPPNDYTKEKLEASVKRTIFWAKRCRREYDKQVEKRKIEKNERPLIFSVIQGGKERDLRKYCAEELIKIGFDGYGFGARPVDENGNWLEEILIYTANLIPENALRFALGIGKPEDIIKCASYGWDMFDCVIPTREGRHGKLFQNASLKMQDCVKEIQKREIQNLGSEFSRNGNTQWYQTININNSKFANDFLPINENSKLSELKNYTKAYLHHLFKMKEPLGARLATLNNLEFYMELMKQISEI